MGGRVLCFFGADGSGKSTLARLVALHLSLKGYRVGVSWLRGTHTLASLLARFLSRFETLRGPCNPYYNICVPGKLRSLWLSLELISVLPVVLWRFVLRRRLLNLVVAERSPVDFLVWLILTLRSTGVAGGIVGRVVLALSLRACDDMVYVRADRGVLAERRRGEREEALIPVQLAIYDRVASALKVDTIDTTSSSINDSLGGAEGYWRHPLVAETLLG
jgi:energy-coupling factor transporter ATP-binding protein EcfA2